MAKSFLDILQIVKVFKHVRSTGLNAISFPGDIYIFGVWSGMSTKFISDWLNFKNIDYHRIYGFDSFIGFPEEKNYKYNQVFKKGGYSSEDLYGKSTDEIIKDMEENIANKRLKFIPGFYSEVLNKKFKKDNNLKVAAYIDIDVDLYSSTKDILEFMFENRLIARGTVIYFDDWGASEEYVSGESLAWKKATEKYNVKYRQICSYGTKPSIQKVFIIE